MKYFLLIKYKDGDEHKKFELVDRVSSFWQKIGYRIGLTWNTLEDYKREALANQVRCWEKVMQEWLDGQGSLHYSVTWKGLYKLLGDIDKPKIAQELKEAVEKAGLKDE